MGSFLRRVPAVFGVCVVVLSLAAGCRAPRRRTEATGTASTRKNRRTRERATAGPRRQRPRAGKGSREEGAGRALQPELGRSGGRAGSGRRPVENLTERGVGGCQELEAGGNRSGDAHHHRSSATARARRRIRTSSSTSRGRPGRKRTVRGSAHAHPALDGRVDLVLNDPASRPGSKDGFTSADCRVNDPVPPPPSWARPARLLRPRAAHLAAGRSGRPWAARDRAHCPSPALPVLLALLVALGAAVSAAGIARSTGQKSQRLQRWARKPSDGSDVRHVTAHEALDGAPDDPGSGEGERRAGKRSRAALTPQEAQRCVASELGQPGPVRVERRLAAGEEVETASLASCELRNPSYIPSPEIGSMRPAASPTIRARPARERRLRRAKRQPVAAHLLEVVEACPC